MFELLTVNKTFLLTENDHKSHRFIPIFTEGVPQINLKWQRVTATSYKDVKSHEKLLLLF